MDIITLAAATKIANDKLAEIENKMFTDDDIPIIVEQVANLLGASSIEEWYERSEENWSN